MHYQHIILLEPLNTQSFASRSSISGPYRRRRRTTQDLQPSRYTQLFKDSFNAPPTSQLLHLCVKRPNLTTSTAIQATFSQSPEYFAVTSSKLKNKNPTSKAVLHPLADECISPIRQTSSMQTGYQVCR
jgi:hypothetical protein